MGLCEGSELDCVVISLAIQLEINSTSVEIRDVRGCCRSGLEWVPMFCRTCAPMQRYLCGVVTPALSIIFLQNFVWAKEKKLRISATLLKPRVAGTGRGGE